MKQLTSADNIFLAAENPRTCNHVSALLILDPSTASAGEITLDGLRTLVASRLERIPVFRWRLAAVPLDIDFPWWYEDPDFDLDFHVRELALPAPGSPDQLVAQVARIFSRPLDRSRPLWEIYLIHGLEDGKVALLTKVHHAAIDGVSGAEVLGSLCDLTPDAEPEAPSPPTGEPRPSDAQLLNRGLVNAALHPRRALRSARRMLGAVDAIPGVANLPGAAAAARLFGNRAAATEGVDRQRPPGSGPKTSFNRPVTAHRRIGLAGLPLEDIKVVKNAFGTTVNDVVMALGAGAIRRWLAEHDELSHEPLVALVPVSVRTTEQAGSFGNQVAGVTVHVPTHLPDMLDRLDAAKAAMDEAKARHEVVPATVLTDAAEFIPPVLLAQATRVLGGLNANARRAPVNVNISNVPGPMIPLYCVGARVEAMYPLAGIADGMGLNITVLSSNGRVNVGVVADRDQMPDVQRIADGMVAELDGLLQLASTKQAAPARTRA